MVAPVSAGLDVLGNLDPPIFVHAAQHSLGNCTGSVVSLSIDIRTTSSEGQKRSSFCC